MNAHQRKMARDKIRKAGGLVNPAEFFLGMYVTGSTWQPYPGHYVKRWCDIRLHDGTTWGPIWPNAGKFRKGSFEFVEAQVKEIRYYEDRKETE